MRGVTVSLNSDGRGLEISTLTPCEGRGLMCFMVSMDTPVISTLTPCEGRGVYTEITQQLQEKFQLSRPVRGVAVLI